VSRFALLFPGQGSQHAGMGSGLVSLDECRAVFDAADAALEQPLSKLCFEGPEEDLALTENTQPAILTVCVAALRALEKALEPQGLQPVAAAGHSLGEYAAHVAAGTFAFDDAVRAVRARGRFMQEAVPVGVGAMAAIIGLKADEVSAICVAAAEDEVVAAANFNGPDQTVIAGHSDAVDRAIVGAEEAGAKRALRLTVSAPFHCSLMAPAAERLTPVLESMGFTAPRFPVYANVDAAPLADADAARSALLRQVDSPVLWNPLVERMIADGIETFVEVGPGRVLSGLLRRMRRGVRVLSVSDAEGAERVAAELGDTA
jgi:[acyl-carrier-protein] S-malonyltransferase